MQRGKACMGFFFIYGIKKDNIAGAALCSMLHALGRIQLTNVINVYENLEDTEVVKFI